MLLRQVNTHLRSGGGGLMLFSKHTDLRRKALLSTFLQVLPSTVRLYPSAHLHMYEPGVFSHSCVQAPGVSLHSSTSVYNKTKATFWHGLTWPHKTFTLQWPVYLVTWPWGGKWPRTQCHTSAGPSISHQCVARVTLAVEAGDGVHTAVFTPVASNITAFINI